MNRRLLITLLVATGLLVLPATAAARVNVAVGIGDQSPQMFADPNWKALKLTKARYFVEWNAIDKPDKLARVDQYVMAARAAKVKVLMHISVDDINSKPRRPLPSVRQYRSKVGALVARYRPAGVTEWGVWNEANHSSQPTQKNAKRAAEFYRSFRTIRCSGCKIVALDVLDQAGVEGYIQRWFKAAGTVGRNSNIVFGIHNYSEVNRRLGAKRKRTESFKKYPGTPRIIRAVRRQNKKAKFWYTETGGLARFGSFGCNRTRQANRTTYMFTLAKRHRKDVNRLYSYNWYGTNCVSFDAGLVERNGAARAAYRTFRNQMRNFRR
ncbi:MAG: hypothetical protein Q8O56_12675 [Solirubrobacteraceae bacterium]|nr:hypothetical protein [Solirubrobacteraceae bacterium]